MATSNEQDISKKTVKELRDLLKSRGVSVPSHSRKEDLLKLASGSGASGTLEKAQSTSTKSDPSLITPKPEEVVESKEIKHSPKFSREELEEMTLIKLKKLANKRGLSQSGRKVDVINRLLRYQRGEEEEISARRGRSVKVTIEESEKPLVRRPSPKSPTSIHPKGRPRSPRTPLGEGPYTQEQLEQRTVVELKEILRGMNMSHTGRKADLVNRILRGETSKPERVGSPRPSEKEIESSRPEPISVSKPVPEIPLVSAESHKVPEIPLVSAESHKVPTGLPQPPLRRAISPKGAIPLTGIPAPRALPTILPSRTQPPLSEM